jgi:hypothetical protein
MIALCVRAYVHTQQTFLLLLLGSSTFCRLYTSCACARHAAVFCHYFPYMKFAIKRGAEPRFALSSLSRSVHDVTPPGLVSLVCDALAVFAFAAAAAL